MSAANTTMVRMPDGVHHSIEMPDPEVIKHFDEFWRPIVTTEDAYGNKTIDMYRLMCELSDYSALMERATEVFEHVTHHQITKINTDSRVVCEVADEAYRNFYEDLDEEEAEE